MVANAVMASTVECKTWRVRLFAAGDMRRGQPLAVRAIREGRQRASTIGKALRGVTALPR